MASRIARVTQRLKSGLLIGSMACFAVVSAQAGTIYFTDFEQPPFSIGNLNGQNGWVATGTAVVENGVANGGAQAVGFAGDTTGVRAFVTTPVNTTLHPVVVETADFIWSDFTSAWSFFGVGLSNNVLGGFTVLPNGALQLATAGSPATPALIIPNVWYTLSVAYDFSADNFAVFLNGSGVAPAVPFLDSTSTQFLTGLYSAGAANGGVLFTDNYSIVASDATPEPGAFGLCLAGLAVLGALQLKRRF